ASITNDLVTDCFGVDEYSMRQPSDEALSQLVNPPVRLTQVTLTGDHRRVRQPGGRDANHPAVEIVCVDDVDPFRSNQGAEPLELAERIRIIKAGQRKLRNRGPSILDFAVERSLRAQRGKPDIVTFGIYAFKHLHCLSF